MAGNLGEVYLESALARFQGMKATAEKAIAQLPDSDLTWQANTECNSVAHIVKHLCGNMLSRWTDPLTTDGEKPDRNRDSEFELDGEGSREALMQQWEEGWSCLLGAIGSFQTDDLTKIVRIRGQGIPLLDAINRQIFHLAYHAGQIVQIAKERLGTDWKTLTIPRGKSDEYLPTGRLG